MKIHQTVLRWSHVAIVVGLTAGVCGGSAEVADDYYQPSLLLHTPLEDLRLIHSKHSEITKRVEKGECLPDVHGIVYGKGGATAETTLLKCDDEATVKSVLEKCGLSCRKLLGTQVRLLKRDAIFQSPKGSVGRERELEAFEARRVGPGDVLIITTVI